jgi:Zn-dependent metalloprotease
MGRMTPASPRRTVPAAPAVHRSIVPPYLLARIAQADPERLPRAVAAARAHLAADDLTRALRLASSPVEVQRTARELHATADLPEGPARAVTDAHGTETLPGTLVRSETDGPTGDLAVDEAFDGLGATYALYSDVYGRASIDGAGLPLDATVHYGDDYDNAFWNGDRMVFGDGDGEVFGRFTASVSVIGHELTHGVTQFTANLDYEGQSGALNESVSDVFGALVEQYAAEQTVAEASWLIGAGLFTSAVQGRALRSMKAPGTAYDDDVLGTDPQPATMAGYVTTADDNGGVHTNSGIPNHAFYLVAAALGGYAWEHAGWIWYDTLTAGAIRASVDFAGFAAATVEAAARRFGATSAEVAAVREAWSTVGVPVARGTTAAAS